MTQDEVKAATKALFESISVMPTRNKEEEKFKAAFTAGVTMLGSLVLDVKRIADAMEKQK